MGDTNLDQMKWGRPDQINLAMTNLVKDKMETRGFSQLITGPTRFWENQSESLLDQCWSNCGQRILSVQNIDYAATDHNLIEVTVNIFGKIRNSNEVRKRMMKNWNDDAYRLEVHNIDWKELYESDNADKSYGIFEEKMKQILDKLAPMRTVQIRKHNKSWLSNESRALMNKRDKIRKQAAFSQDPSDWNMYKRTKNKCTEKIRNEKRKHFKNLYKKFERENDVSSLYRVTKSQLGWNNCSTPETFLINGQRESSPSKMADIQLAAFNNKIKKLSGSIPITGRDPLRALKLALHKWGEHATARPEFEITEITSSQTALLLKQMGKSKTFGHDEIDANSLKLATGSLIKPLTYILNQSIRESVYPAKWKLAKLIPIYKDNGSSRMDLENYHPISILSTVSKLAEIIIQKQILEYLDKTSQLNMNHHAYRPKHSTVTAMIQVMDRIYSATDMKQISTVMTIDQSAAFDMVSHQIMIDKMKLYKFSTLNGKHSKITEIKSGVPQGSVLGLLMYSLYINELPNIVKKHENCENLSHEQNTELYGPNCTECSQMICYTDDGTVIHSSHSRTSNQNYLTEDLENINDYLTDNKLKINRDKTTILEVMIRQKRSKIHGQPPTLQVTDKDNNLNTEMWKIHSITGRKY